MGFYHPHQNVNFNKIFFIELMKESTNKWFWGFLNKKKKYFFKAKIMHFWELGIDIFFVHYEKKISWYKHWWLVYNANHQPLTEMYI